MANGRCCGSSDAQLLPDPESSGEPRKVRACLPRNPPAEDEDLGLAKLWLGPGVSPQLPPELNFIKLSTDIREEFFFTQLSSTSEKNFFNTIEMTFGRGDIVLAISIGYFFISTSLFAFHSRHMPEYQMRRPAVEMGSPMIIAPELPKVTPSGSNPVAP